MNIFDLRGPQFLAVYGVLIGLSTLVAFVYRQWRRNNGGAEDHRLLDLGPYEIAYLRGGEKAIVSALFARLVQTKTIEAQGTNFVIHAAKHDDAILQELASSLNPRTISASDVRILVLQWANGIKRSTGQIARKLEQTGLILTQTQSNQIYSAAALVALSPILVAIPKVVIGIDRGKPVGFLCVMIFINLVIAALIWSVRTSLTSRGEQALALIVKKNQSLKTNAKHNPDALTPAQVALAAALFGPTIFSAGLLGDLHRRVMPTNSISGCGSGSSCGGGGCGGGCGGCGG